MEVKTLSFHVSSKGNTDIIDITDTVQSKLKESGLRNGNVLIFAPGSTAGITTIENEPGLLQDYPEFFERIIPVKAGYHHDATWDDGNGYAHVRASLQGASFTVPFSERKLMLGTWQQIILIDFDSRSRKRNVITQFIGE
ncbi:MAG: secondary thiamine-phosphate synthase enzyme YjbQ [Melioribacteraceae bacterium]|jgi:secondary thiamine-phosphate synthase enzyme|nr:secondary thiamine-phosphate synthase enzyme YjbQ [Melioribacteraceae bacterium]